MWVWMIFSAKKIIHAHIFYQTLLSPHAVASILVASKSGLCVSFTI